MSQWSQKNATDFDFVAENKQTKNQDAIGMGEWPLVEALNLQLSNEFASVIHKRLPGLWLTSLDVYLTFVSDKKKRKSSDGSKKVSKKLKSSESSSVKIFGFEKVSAAGSKYFKTWCDLHGAFHLVEQKLLRMLVQTV